MHCFLISSYCLAHKLCIFLSQSLSFIVIALTMEKRWQEICVTHIIMHKSHNSDIVAIILTELAFNLQGSCMK